MGVRKCALVVAIGVTLSVAACGSPSNSKLSPTPPATSTTVVVSSSAYQDLPVVRVDASRMAPGSMQDLVRSAAFVVEGVATKATERANLGTIPPAEAAKARSAGATNLPDAVPDPTTLWMFNVTRVVIPAKGFSLAPGSEVAVMVSGGVYQGVRYVIDDVPQFELGKTYLMFPVQYSGVTFLGIFPDTQSVEVVTGHVRLVGRDPKAPARDALIGHDFESEDAFLAQVLAAR